MGVRFVDDNEMEVEVGAKRKLTAREFLLFRAERGNAIAIAVATARTRCDDDENCDVAVWF